MQGQISHNFSQPTPARRGFTIVEIIFGILIIAIIMGLLIISVQAARRSVNAAVAANELREIGKAIETFQNEFGFAVPLVAERRLLTGDNAGGWNAIVTTTVAAPDRNSIRVYNRGDANDLEVLRGVNSSSVPTATSPFGSNSDQIAANNGNTLTAGFDQRFSTLSVPYFLVGALESPYAAGVTGVPIDGVPGQGFFPPRAAGSFDVPESVRRAAANARKDVGKRFESFVKVDGAFKLVVEATASGGRRIELQDRNGAAVRYYLWINEFNDNGTWREPRTLPELSVPRLIGRYVDETGTLSPASSVPGESVVPASRDISKNPALNGRYMWALLAAGPNGVFGDESDAAIARGLGVSASASPQELIRRRFDAERDNIVVYGEAKR
ncbi:MAG: hypothetical protein ACK5ZG_02415 [Phycisphaerae bacterium]|jgi:type II secretory pathway pseudopilin PulG